MDGLSKREIGQRLKLPLRTIEYYSNEGLVVDDITQVSGKGRTKLFSRANLVEFGMAAFMVKHVNIPIKLVLLALEGLRRGSFGISRTQFLFDEEWGNTREMILIVDQMNRYTPFDLDYGGSHKMPEAIFNKIFCDPKILMSHVLFLGHLKLKALEVYNIQP